MNIDILFTCKGNVNTAIIRNDRLKNKYPELYQYVMKQFPLYTDIRNKILALKHGDYCRCKNCGNIMNFPGYTLKVPYCSSKCGNNNPHKTRQRKRSKETDEKIKKTCLERYGAENPFSSKQIQDKVIQTFIEKYGVTNVGAAESIRDKVTQTLIEKYGVTNVSQIKSVQEKVKATRVRSALKEYDTKLNSKYEYIKSFGIECTKEQAESITIGETYKLISKEMIEIKLGLRQPDADIIRQNYAHFYPWFHKYNIDVKRWGPSTDQKEINDWLNSIGIETIFNSRKIIAPKELDIYIPSHKIAIEYNGLYWHDSFKTDTKYHLEKTEECEKHGIQCIHIFEHEWAHKKDLVKSIILSKLGLSKRIYARKCELKKVDKKEYSRFFDENHLSGNTSAFVAYGLYYDSELVMCMSFSNNRRFDKTCDWELIRMASKQGITVIGGLSKILKHFIKEHSPKKLLSYADRRISIGKSYQSVGFDFISKTIPNYWYIERKTMKFYSRHSMMKHKLKEFPTYNENKSESEIIKDSNMYYRLHDCGNLKFVLNIE